MVVMVIERLDGRRHEHHEEDNQGSTTKHGPRTSNGYATQICRQMLGLLHDHQHWFTATTGPRRSRDRADDTPRSRTLDLPCRRSRVATSRVSPRICVEERYGTEVAEGRLTLMQPTLARRMARLLSVALSTAAFALVTSSTTAAWADAPKHGAATATALAQDSAPKAKPKAAPKAKAKPHAKAKLHAKAKVASKHRAAKHATTAQKPRPKR